MLTITISARAVLVAALITLAAAAALYATDAFGSDPPDSILQGDTDCDGDVDAQDALNDLRYVGGLEVGPFGGCPQIGTEAAIPGPQGPQGEPGPPGLANVEIVTEDSVQSSSETHAATASCPAGKTIIGGGARITSGGSSEGLAISNSWPTGDLTTWVAGALETAPNASSWRVRAIAICADVAE